MIINANQGGGGNLQEKTATPSTAQQVITPDSQYDGLSKVTIAPTPLETITVKSSTAQQPPITPTSPNIGFSSITVEPNLLQTKSVTLPTSQPIQPDSGYYGLSGVNVSAPLYSYPAVTPTSSIQTLNVPSGYYGLNQVTVNAAKETGWYTYVTFGRTSSFQIENPGIDELAVWSIFVQTNSFSNMNQYDLMYMQGGATTYLRGAFLSYSESSKVGTVEICSVGSLTGGSIILNSNDIIFMLPKYGGNQLYLSANSYCIMFAGNEIK